MVRKGGASDLGVRYIARRSPIAWVPLIDKRSAIAVPELPEVETIRRGLLQRLVGHEIIGVRVRQPYLREKVEVDMLQTYVPGRTVADIERRAKYLLVRLHPQGILVVHLCITGR